jgi:O-acetylhomoserine/O-acetylserine sulfhydrylase-like pyridoxal-dependent enzyme
MGYIETALKRANIQDLRSFILHGTDELNICTDTYEERLDSATASMHVRLKTHYPDMEEQQDAINDLNYALSNYQDVYTEIGMKLGARLILELLSPDRLPS